MSADIVQYRKKKNFKSVLRKYPRRIVIAATAAFVLWGIFIFQTVSGWLVRDDYKVLEAFRSSEFTESVSVIEAYGKYGTGELEIAGRENLVKEIAESLELDGYSISSEVGDGKMTTTLQKQNSSAETTIQVITIEDKFGAQTLERRQYLMITLRLYEGMEKSLAYRELVEEIMKEHEVDVYATMDLQGTYDGELNQDECSYAADQILSTLDAKVVTENRGNDIFTIYAYSRYLKKYKGGSYDNINVNLAMRYNEVEDKTYLYVSTPVIRDDY